MIGKAIYGILVFACLLVTSSVRSQNNLTEAVLEQLQNHHTSLTQVKAWRKEHFQKMRDSDIPRWVYNTSAVGGLAIMGGVGTFVAIEILSLQRVAYTIERYAHLNIVKNFGVHLQIISGGGQSYDLFRSISPYSGKFIGCVAAQKVLLNNLGKSLATSLSTTMVLGGAYGLTDFDLTTFKNSIRLNITSKNFKNEIENSELVVDFSEEQNKITPENFYKKMIELKKLEETYTSIFMDTWELFPKIRKESLGEFNIEFMYHRYYVVLERFHRKVIDELISFAQSQLLPIDFSKFKN